MYVTWFRPTDEILYLMNPTTGSSSISTTIAPIPRSPTITYFGAPLKDTNITESQHGYKLEFKSDSPVNISVKDNFTFNQLVKKINEIIHLVTTK